MDEELREACRDWLTWRRSGATTEQGEEDALVEFVRYRERKARTRLLEETSEGLRDAIKKP